MDYVHSVRRKSKVESVLSKSAIQSMILSTELAKRNKAWGGGGGDLNPWTLDSQNC